MIKRYCYTIVLLLIAFCGCRQKFLPPVIATNSNYLVVEGIINSSSTDSTFIKLSRTVPLNNVTSIKAETSAQISIESDANTTYPLKELKTIGTYAAAPLNLNKSAKYRLRIITADRKTYLSDFVPVKEAPAIDSLGYMTPVNGLQLYVNAHDATNNTRYYRYEYVETWQFISAFSASFIVSGTDIVPRSQSQRVDVCWGNDASSDVILATTSNLTQDVLFQTPITTVPAISEKLGIEYSILVKQYALTKEAFDFWQNLKKNTEQLGSIFDAQPSTVNGNIHNATNSSEPVFGYISAGTVQQKRIFVHNTSLPASWGSDRSVYSKCLADTVYPLSDPRQLRNVDPKNYVYADYFFGKNPSWLPIYPAYNSLGVLIGYTGSSRFCTDCTLRGTNKQPAFWQ
ncbi:MAG TPA: DUF4249 domain-containing protein [Mucilaginibacter sp.]|nr:DUF4249 domain-containing protein [Mucilaginibacter sp.]